MRHIAASPEAIAAIKRKLEAAARDPELASLVPVLFVAFDEAVSKGGQVIEHFSGVFFDIGWSPKGVLGAAKADYKEVTIGQMVVIAEVHALKLLSGNRLELKTIEVGVPTPSDVKAEILIARSR